jgi:hypothetical protein
LVPMTVELRRVIPVPLVPTTNKLARPVAKTVNQASTKTKLTKTAAKTVTVENTVLRVPPVVCLMPQVVQLVPMTVELCRVIPVLLENTTIKLDCPVAKTVHKENGLTLLASLQIINVNFVPLDVI